MWIYEKKLQYPVNIKNPNPRLAGVIISQLGGPDGELAASMRYLNQRYVMPYGEVKGLLTDIGILLTKLHHYHIFQNHFHFDIKTYSSSHFHIFQEYRLYLNDLDIYLQ